MKKYFRMTKWYTCWHLIHQHYRYHQIQDFIGPLFIDTALDKIHYMLNDATGLLLDGMYHMNRIKKGSEHTLQGIVNTFDGYKKYLKTHYSTNLQLKHLIIKYR